MAKEAVVIKEAITPLEAEWMRRARNTCREFMTHDQRELSIDEQERWFKAIDRNLVKPYVVFCPLQGSSPPIGFGIIKLYQDQWWVTGGLFPKWRGKGYGRDLFGTLADIVNFKLMQTCWLDVFEDNIAAIRTYQKLGFVDVAASIDGMSTRATLTMKRELQ